MKAASVAIIFFLCGGLAIYRYPNLIRDLMGEPILLTQPPPRLQVGTTLASLTVPSVVGTPVTLKNCTVVAIQPDGIRVMHENGSAKIPFEHLSPSLQFAVDHDPTKAAAFRSQQQAEARAAAIAAQKTAENIAKSHASVPVSSQPARQPVTIRGDVLPSHRAGDAFIVRLSNGRFVSVSGMKRGQDRNGYSITLAAYPTGSHDSFENNLIPVYSVTP